MLKTYNFLQDVNLKLHQRKPFSDSHIFMFGKALKAKSMKGIHQMRYLLSGNNIAPQS